jgi:hypothetical protein
VFKYPRTQHIKGLRLQVGDEDLDSVLFSAIAGRYNVLGDCSTLLVNDCIPSTLFFTIFYLIIS